LRPFDPTSLLDGRDVVGSRLAETFAIVWFDETGQRQFPGLLLMVIDLAQFRRVQPKFSGHLYLAVETNDRAFAPRSIFALADLF
jgi:hypothetical protein